MVVQVGPLLAPKSLTLTDLYPVLVPIYVSETVPKEIRGGLVACYQLFVTLGLLTSYIVNFGTSHVHNSAQWRGAIAIGYTWGICLGIGTFFVPESPRWLLQHGHVGKARAALTWVHGGSARADPNRVEAEMVEIQKMVNEANQVGQGNWLNSFSPKEKALYRTVLGFMLQAFQQLTGANYFFYYGVAVFKSVGITNSFITQIILGAVNVICTFPGLYFIERFGRRKPLIFGGLWQMCWLIIFGAIGSEVDPNKKEVGIVMIVSACLFIASFASTWGPGIWVASEHISVPRTPRTHQLMFCSGRTLSDTYSRFFGIDSHHRELDVEFFAHLLYTTHHQSDSVPLWIRFRWLQCARSVHGVLFLLRKCWIDT